MKDRHSNFIKTKQEEFKRMAENKHESKNDIEFKVYPDHGIVVCRLLNCSNIAVDRITKYTGYYYYHLEIDDVYVGVAKCAPEDTFNENIGKKLALAKAKKKRAKAINNMIKKWLVKERRLLNNLEQYGIHEVPEIPNVEVDENGKSVLIFQ